MSTSQIYDLSIQIRIQYRMLNIGTRIRTKRPSLCALFPPPSVEEPPEPWGNSGFGRARVHMKVKPDETTIFSFILYFVWACFKEFLTRRFILPCSTKKKDSKQLLKLILALFSSKKFCKIGILLLSFVFDKYYPIIY